MKTNRLVMLICLMWFYGTLLGQNLTELKDYSLDEKPNYHKFNDPKEAIIGVKDKVIVNYEYGDDNKLAEYYLEHRAMILNTDEVIEDNNKLYIPISSSSSKLLVMKARVINKNGEIIDLDESKIFTSKNEETNSEYRYYAYEGIEIGSIVEYYYILKRSPSYSGKKHTLQSSYNKYNLNFELFSPNNLYFKFKSYNGLNEVVLDTSAKDYYHWETKVDSLTKLDNEEQSAFNANKKFLIYKLDQNSYSKKYDLSSYGGIASDIYNYYYKELTKQEKKSITKIIKESNCKIARDKPAKIRAIEDYIKLTYYVAEYDNSELTDITKIVTNKIASKQGIVKLYTAILRELEIDCQIVMTCDRFNLKFDKEFEAYNFLVNYLIYFPKLKSFLSPTDISSRLGYPPSELTNTYGLFVKEINVNNLKTGLGKIKFINPIEYTKNFDKMRVNVNIDKDDIHQSIVELDRSTGGYYAMNIQPFMNLFKEENKKEIIDEYIKFIDNDINIIKKKVFYDDAKYFGIEPFQVIAEFKLSSFIENAGDNIILKVGNLIGPQMEMYQKKERVQPIETRFKRNYDRVITLNIPEKYKIKNLDDLNIYNEYKIDDKVVMYFKSSYTFEGNKLVITANEYYDIIEVKPELYNTYRKIINSAADFNKVSLILE